MNPYDDIEEVDELPAPPRKEIPSADRELLELAARALGARFEEVDGEGYGNLHFEDGATAYAWNPLVHSDDAFNLAVRLNLHKAMELAHRLVDDKTDFYAAARLSVTRAAAEIGKAMAK